jgi:hypothetical protein
MCVQQDTLFQDANIAIKEIKKEKQCYESYLDYCNTVV